MNRMSFSLSLYARIAVLIGLSVLCSALYLHDGMSAKLLVFLGALMLAVVSLVGLFHTQQKQTEQVIRALANGDFTLGFGESHPLRAQLNEVKTQMQTTRFNLEQQAQFLQALLVHIELAIIVFDEQDKVVEINPASAKVLGKSIHNVADLEHLAPLVEQTHSSLKTIANWQRGEQTDTLSLQISTALIQGKQRKIMTLHSIRDALQSKEQQAYKRLTHVLTHEIANSITPLSSIAQTCLGLVPDGDHFASDEDKDDLNLALTTLAKRTEHLSEFIARFRQVSNVPKPNLHAEPLDALARRAHQLHLGLCNAANIRFDLEINHTALVMLDSAQIEQVLINLIKNAIEAVTASQQTPTNDAAIAIKTGQNTAGQSFIEVTDTGAGVADHVIELMFVPFFTTKQQGSGIGLSLSKQVMQLHGGDLVYLKRPVGACFRCVFG